MKTVRFNPVFYSQADRIVDLILFDFFVLSCCLGLNTLQSICFDRACQQEGLPICIASPAKWKLVCCTAGWGRSISIGGTTARFKYSALVQYLNMLPHVHRFLDDK